jgi:hypothetical protein
MRKHSMLARICKSDFILTKIVDAIDQINPVVGMIQLFSDGD